MLCEVTPEEYSCLDDLGAEIAKIRKRRKWSQDELAAKAGISSATLSKIECAETKYVPSTIVLIRICAALGKKPGALIDQSFPLSIRQE